MLGWLIVYKSSFFPLSSSQFLISAQSSLSNCTTCVVLCSFRYTLFILLFKLCIRNADNNHVSGEEPTFEVINSNLRSLSSIFIFNFLPETKMMHGWFEILKQEKPQRRYWYDRNSKDVRLYPNDSSSGHTLAIKNRGTLCLLRHKVLPSNSRSNR